MNETKTVRGLYAKLGTYAAYFPEGRYSISFLVKIIDVRNVWGRDQYRIEPVRGQGSKWVNAESIMPVATPTDLLSGGES